MKLIQGYSPVTAAVSTNTVGLSTEAQGSIYLDLATQELNNAPVTVNINKFNANTGEVNLNIASTTDQVGTAILPHTISQRSMVMQASMQVQTSLLMQVLQ